MHPREHEDNVAQQGLGIWWLLCGLGGKRPGRRYSERFIPAFAACASIAATAPRAL